MKIPLTILLPVYNGQQYLNQCIDSILCQAYDDYELLIIDDCSIDNSKDIINNYNDNRITFIENEHNIGLTSTLNKGIQQAKGNYIGRIDQDDLSMENRIIEQMNYLSNNPDVKLIGSWCEIIDENDNKIKSIKNPINRKKILEAFVSYNPFLHSSVIFEKTTVSKLGGYSSSFVHAQDFDLWYKISSKNNVHNIPIELVKIRWHSQRATLSDHNKKYLKDESIKIYYYAINNREISYFARVMGRLRLFFKPWFFRKLIGLSPRF